MKSANKSKRLTDAEFLSHCAGPNSVSRYSLAQGLERAKLRDITIGPLLAAGVDYALAAKMADRAVVERMGA